jgi:hypothetical protein
MRIRTETAGGGEASRAGLGLRQTRDMEIMDAALRVCGTDRETKTGRTG